MNSKKTALFRELHQGPRILMLPNAWDVSSARIFEEAGFPAVGTSSAGVANILGYADGERTPGAEMIAFCGRIARALRIPVTADVEAGYGDPLGTAQALADAGLAGMNLEDTLGHEPGSLVDLRTQTRAIEQIRAKTDLVINARCDIYLAGIGDPATRFDRIVERLNAYRQAGADCLFAPGVRDAGTIGRLTHAVNGPLNVLVGPGMPPAAELERLGVRRVSVGSGPMRATMGLTQRIAKELRGPGTYSWLEGSLSYVDANRLFEPRP
ncbi:MAG TPA: isocitrate lyase/phosphoenolpyruvate mutase family protein [Bryobacteraceae bacterium]|nr:isocitrate lyase/phosphoenolpyruvate mutase family protein [Bryobacteraceae bacterium]